MALNTVHFAFNDRVMLGETKFRPRFLVALKAAFRVLAGIDDKFFQAAPARHGDVLASWTVAGFAAGLAWHIGGGEAQSRMRARGKNTGDIRMTIEARLIADERGAFNLKRDNYRPLGGTGIEQ